MIAVDENYDDSNSPSTSGSKAVVYSLNHVKHFFTLKLVSSDLECRRELK